MQRDRFDMAMRRMRRRQALWAAARAACPDVDSASVAAIERAISALLAEEFPAT